MPQHLRTSQNPTGRSNIRSSRRVLALDRMHLVSGIIANALIGQRVRDVLLAKVPDSSFAEAHRGFSSELTHVEDEVKHQEEEVEDG